MPGALSVRERAKLRHSRMRPPLLTVLTWPKSFPHQNQATVLHVSESLRFGHIDFEPLGSLNSTCVARMTLHRGYFQFPVHQRRRSPGDLNSKPSGGLGIPHHPEQKLQWGDSRVSGS